MFKLTPSLMINLKREDVVSVAYHMYIQSNALPTRSWVKNPWALPWYVGVERTIDGEHPKLHRIVVSSLYLMSSERASDVDWRGAEMTISDQL
jgi:hypothetical protein